MKSGCLKDTRYNSSDYLDSASILISKGTILDDNIHEVRHCVKEELTHEVQLVCHLLTFNILLTTS